jgi:hypothetical protein
MSRNQKKPRPYGLLAVPAAITLLALAGAAPAGAAPGDSFGLGIHYWQTVDDLFDGAGLEEDGVSYILSYQRNPSRGILRFELDLEYFDEGFGGAAEEAFAPVAFLLVGRKFYVGAGIGVTYSSGLPDDFSDPFFAGRFGWDFALLPALSLDLNVNYRTNTFNELGDLDTDVFTLGAIVRFRVGG